MSEQPVERPMLRLLRGDAAPEELAAVLTVLASRARAGSSDAEPPAQRGGWSDRAAAVCAPLRPGPGAWRRSARSR